MRSLAMFLIGLVLGFFSVLWLNGLRIWMRTVSWILSQQMWTILGVVLAIVALLLFVSNKNKD